MLSPNTEWATSDSSGITLATGTLAVDMLWRLCDITEIMWYQLKRTDIPLTGRQETIGHYRGQLWEWSIDSMSQYMLTLFAKQLGHVW